MVKLRNGTEEAEPLVTVTMMTLKKLGFLVIYELVEICKDSDHQPFGDIGKDLEELPFVGTNDGAPFPIGIPRKYIIHDSIRNIILSAVEGDGLDMHLVNPVAPATGVS